APRRPTPFPTRRSSDLYEEANRGAPVESTSDEPSIENRRLESSTGAEGSESVSTAAVADLLPQESAESLVWTVDQLCARLGMQQVARRPKSGAPFAVLTSRRTVALVERHRSEDV